MTAQTYCNKVKCWKRAVRHISPSCNTSWSVFPLEFVLPCVICHEVSSPSRFFVFGNWIFFMATILQLKVAKRRLFKKVSLERCIWRLVNTDYGDVWWTKWINLTPVRLAILFALFIMLWLCASLALWKWKHSMGWYVVLAFINTVVRVILVSVFVLVFDPCKPWCETFCCLKKHYM